MENLSSGAFPKFKDETDRFLDDKQGPCCKFQDNLTGIQVLLEKQGELERVLDMPWVVRRCLSGPGGGDDKMLPEAIKILHIVMDYKKSLGENNSDSVPPVLAVSFFKNQ